MKLYAGSVDLTANPRTTLLMKFTPTPGTLLPLQVIALSRFTLVAVLLIFAIIYLAQETKTILWLPAALSTSILTAPR